MGTWGTRIYENDNALDLRGDFLEKLNNGGDIEDIEASIKDEYIDNDLPDDSDVAILALACAELETGTLTEGTKNLALEVIDSGRQYQFWQKESSPAEAGRRKKELTLIKKYLDDYDGKPVKRKSWVELQKADPVSEDDEKNEKLDDVSWHMQDESYDGESDDDYFARHATTVVAIVHWAAVRGLLAKELQNNRATQQYLKSKNPNIFKYVEDTIDGKLMNTDFERGKVRDFVKAYHDTKFIDDIIENIQNEREDYSYIVNHAELEAMAKVIDERFNQYQEDPTQFVADKQIALVQRKRTIPRVALGILILVAFTSTIIGFLLHLFLALNNLWSLVSN